MSTSEWRPNWPEAGASLGFWTEVSSQHLIDSEMADRKVQFETGRDTAASEKWETLLKSSFWITQSRQHQIVYFQLLNYFHIIQ